MESNKIAYPADVHIFIFGWRTNFLPHPELPRDQVGQGGPRVACFSLFKLAMPFGFLLSCWIRGFILGFLRRHEQNGFSVFLSHNKLWESSRSSKRHVDFFFLSFCSLVVCRRGGEDIWAFGRAFLIIIIFLKIQFVMLHQAAHKIVSFLDMTSDLVPRVCPLWWEPGSKASSYGI